LIANETVEVAGDEGVELDYEKFGRYYAAWEEKMMSSTDLDDDYSYEY
jgi:hypothetical protein